MARRDLRPGRRDRRSRRRSAARRRPERHRRRARPGRAAHAVGRRLRRHHLPEGVRRAGPHRRAPPHVHGRSARLRPRRMRPDVRDDAGHDGPDPAGARVRRPEGAVPPGDDPGRRPLGAVPLRTDRRLRPRRRGHSGDARRRRLPPHRVEGLDERSRLLRLRLLSGPHRLGRPQAPRAHDVRRAAACPRARGDPVAPRHRRDRVLPGVLRQRRRPRDRRHRRRERRLERRVAAARARTQRDRRGLGVPRHGRRRRAWPAAPSSAVTVSTSPSSPARAASPPTRTAGSSWPRPTCSPPSTASSPPGCRPRRPSACSRPRPARS